MRTAADYFGLMAYIWVMSGGMPEADLLSPAERRTVRPRPRTRRGLRVIDGGLARSTSAAARLSQTGDANEAAA